MNSIIGTGIVLIFLGIVAGMEFEEHTGFFLRKWKQWRS